MSRRDGTERRHRIGRPVPGMLGAGAIGGLALSSGLALTATSGWLIVAASLRPQILTLLSAIVLVRAFGIARPVLRYTERVRSHDRALGWLARERAAVYARLIPLTPARLGRRSRGQVLAGVVDDLDDLASAQVRVLVPLMALAVTGVIAVALTAVVYPSAAPVTGSTVLCCLVVGVVGWWLEYRSLPALLAARGRLAQLATLVADNAGELTAIGAREQAMAWVATAQHALRAATRRQRWGRAIGTAAIPLVVAGHTIWLAILVAPQVSDAVADPLPTPLAALVVLIPVALGEVVAGVPDAVGSLARAQAAAARLDGLLDQQPAVTHPRVEDTEASPTGASPTGASPTGAAGAPTGPAHAAPTGPGDATTNGVAVDGVAVDGVAVDGVAVDGFAIPTGVPRLTLEQVSGSWDGVTIALAPQNRRFGPGGLIGVTGPNGCGKSTLLAVLARHLDPHAGRYRQDDVDVHRLSLAQSRRRLAVVDDEPHVFASTLRENLRFAAPGCSDAAILDALTRAGLRSWYDGLPRGLSTMLGSAAWQATRAGLDDIDGPGGDRRTRGVSGGERARLGLARALLSGRGVLLLDEPVAHLDHATAVEVMRDIAATALAPEPAGGGDGRPARTVIVVSHRPEGLDGADSVIRLRAPRSDQRDETMRQAGRPMTR